jgi:hypothetical protein
VADVLATALRCEGKIPVFGQIPDLREWVTDQIEELREIGRSLTVVCEDLIPGAPAAREFHFFSILKDFGLPPLSGGPEINKPVSQKLTPDRSE